MELIVIGVVVLFIATLLSTLMVVTAWLNRSGGHEANLDD
jgi:hypothetical protein